jgi:hypothetical protein
MKREGKKKTGEVGDKWPAKRGRSKAGKRTAVVKRHGKEKSMLTSQSQIKDDYCVMKTRIVTDDDDRKLDEGSAL